MAEDGAPLIAGRSYRDAPEIDGLVWARGSAPAGSFVDVQIERATPYDLWGSIQQRAQLDSSLESSARLEALALT